MSASQHPNQPPPGPFGAPEPTIAIGGPLKPPVDDADATHIVPGFDQPEKTQVVRPGATPNGAIPQQPEATQAIRPGAPMPQSAPQGYGQPPQGYPQPQQYGQPPPGYPQPQQAPGFGQQLAQQQPGYPPQQPGYPPQQPHSYPHPQAYQYGGPHQYAEWGKRALAGLIDYVLLGAIAVTLLVTTANFAIVAIFQLLNLVNLFYNICYLGGEKGQTFGKQVAGIKLIREDSGQPVGFGLAFGRALLHIIDALPLYIGFFAPLWDEKRQTWSDKIVGTVVVVAPKPGQGYQAPQQYGQMPRQW
jgi:uncharacterized RDD family membrane protein YckC